MIPFALHQALHALASGNSDTMRRGLRLAALHRQLHFHGITTTPTTRTQRTCQRVQSQLLAQLGDELDKHAMYLQRAAVRSPRPWACPRYKAICTLQRSTWPDELFAPHKHNAIVPDSTVRAQEVAVHDCLELASTYYFLTLSLTMSLRTLARSTFQLCGPTCTRGARTCRKHYIIMYVVGFEAETTQNVCTGVASVTPGFRPYVQ